MVDREPEEGQDEDHWNASDRALSVGYWEKSRSPKQFAEDDVGDGLDGMKETSRNVKKDDLGSFFESPYDDGDDSDKFESLWRDQGSAQLSEEGHKKAILATSSVANASNAVSEKTAPLNVSGKGLSMSNATAQISPSSSYPGPGVSSVKSVASISISNINTARRTRTRASISPSQARKESQHVKSTVPNTEDSGWHEEADGTVKSSDARQLTRLLMQFQATVMNTLEEQAMLLRRIDQRLEEHLATCPGGSSNADIAAELSRSASAGTESSTKATSKEPPRTKTDPIRRADLTRPTPARAKTKSLLAMEVSNTSLFDEAEDGDAPSTRNKNQLNEIDEGEAGSSVLPLTSPRGKKGAILNTTDLRNEREEAEKEKEQQNSKKASMKEWRDKQKTWAASVSSAGTPATNEGSRSPQRKGGAVAGVKEREKTPRRQSTVEEVAAEMAAVISANGLDKIKGLRSVLTQGRTFVKKILVQLKEVCLR